jgi:hypothetical protein
MRFHTIEILSATDVSDFSSSGRQEIEDLLKLHRAFYILNV